MNMNQELICFLIMKKIFAKKREKTLLSNINIYVQIDKLILYKY
jgi:hypothetical protein